MPVGQWNSSRIVFVGNHGEHWLNGEKIVEAEMQKPAANTQLKSRKAALDQGRELGDKILGICSR